MPTTLKSKDSATRPSGAVGSEEKRVILPVKKPTKKTGQESLAKGQKKPRTRAEVRQDLVKKYKAILKKGTYQIKADEIADKMVQKIREDKNQVLF